MLGRKQIPVYLFTGFLESGKTTFIRESLEEGQFEDGRRTLLVLCEEGEEEVPKALLDKNRFTVKTIEDEEDVSTQLLQAFDKEVKPHRVMIEANGMWDVSELLQAFPNNWELAEGITTVDSTTFETYLANMKMMMTNQFRMADLVVFNRCTEQHDRAMFKRMVRAVNKRAQVLYEDPQGNVDNKVDEELPYDLNAPVIEIADDDFGIWYLDAMDHLENYRGKTLKFKAMVLHPKKAPADMFVPGRFAMTCCAEDVAFVGYPCKYDEASFLKDKTWIMVTVEVGAVMNREMGQEIPALKAIAVEPAEPAEDEIVYFN